MTSADNIRKAFGGLPGPAAILDEVGDFYADKLEFVDGLPGAVTSNYTLDCDTEHLLFKAARVILAPSTDRPAAAATHELLHLRLPIRGYPRVRSLELNRVQGPIAAELDETLGKILNVVDHDIFVGDFVATGLPLSEFLGPVSADPNYKRTWQEMERKPTPQPLMFYWWVWWTLEYLRHSISIEHGVRTAERSAEKVEKWGGKALHGFASETKGLRNWVKAGQHKKADTYADSIRELLQIMRMPPPSFYTVQRLTTGDIHLQAL